MRNSRHFLRLAKSKGARALAMVAAILLTLEPCVFAFTQVVSKYPTGTPTITSVDMGGGNMLDYGSVFGFNSAKSASDADAYAEIREGACVPEGTSYTFISGMEGWSGVPVLNMNYMFDSTIGGGSIKAVFAKKNASATYTWQKTFFYDCGQPSPVGFSLKYTRGVWTSPGATNNFSVTLTKPDASSVTLINSTTITATSLTNVNGTIAASDLAQVGTYTLKVTGTLSTANTVGAKVEVAFDDIDLSKTVQAAYGSFQQNVEFTVSGTPVSSLGSNQYLLDIRAKKPAGDAESTYIQVCGDNLPTCGSWTTRYTVSSTAWTTFNAYYLTTAEYNGGNVRVRYVDATPAGDSSQGGVDVEYQRITVDQGVCVDQVTDSAADCGKCHNYGGDITKPWPSLGMHNKHAQTESTNDCLWCHPNNGTDSAHRDGAVKIAGTKVFRVADGNLNGAPANANYDGTTKQCSNVDCHKNLTTPAWDSVEGVGGFYPNCSRCHNTTGTKAPDASGNLNIDSAWPNDAGGGHSKHDTAFNLTEASCQSSGSCHPDNRSQHSVVGDGKVEVKMASAYASPNKIPKFIPDTTNGTGTCANMACHGGQQTPRFNLASTNPIDVPTQCTKCHTAEQGTGWGTSAGNATQWNSPISGLHRGSPPTSGKSHIADYGCTQCHIEPAQHFTTAGVSNLTDTAMDALTPTDFQTGMNVTVGSGGTRPNWTTPTTCSTTPGLTGGNPVGPCHAEGDSAVRNPATSWARRWSWDAYDTATPLNQCKNCHGHWGSFNAGVVEPHVYTNGNTVLRDNLIANHQDVGNDCATLCHGQTDTSAYVDGPSPTNSGYNHGVAMTASAKTMDINRNITRNDYGTTIGCDNCHTNQNNVVDNVANPGSGHGFQESGWLKLNRPDGPAAGGCIACHGDTAMIATATGSVTGENGNFSTVGGHRHHGGGAARNGAVTDDTCTACHANTAQNMGESSATLDKIQLKNADTGAVIVWDQNAPNQANMVTFCLSCHDSNGANGNMTPFGDGVTVPNIATQYLNTTTGKSHNYNYNTVPQLTKAASPHGKPTLNNMKQATDQSTYTDANPVGCQNCHPAHGSSTTNPQPVITGGADINTTTIPLRMMKTGYSEPGSCWGCHDTVGVKEYYGDGDNDLNGTTDSHWVNNANSAFSYKKRDYWSRHQVLRTSFNPSTSPRTTQDAPNFGTEIACSICHDPHGASNWTGAGGTEYQAFSLRGNWLTSPYLEDRACKKNGASGAAVWAKTDGGAVLTGPRNTPLASYNQAPEYGGGYGTSGGSGHDGFYIDENTLGVTGDLATGNISITRLTETDTQFAGLCANCHAASVSGSSGGTVASMKTYLMAKASDTGWASGKIHYTVKGWGTAAQADPVNPTNLSNRMHLAFGTTDLTTGPYGYQSSAYTRSRGNFQWGANVLSAQAQKYHEFSCSKCHTPHASSLPRLLVTNCLDVGSSTTAHASVSPATNNTAGTARYAYTYPTFATAAAGAPAVGWTFKTKPSWWVGASTPLTNPNEAAIHCHNRGKSNTAGGGWNTLTGY